MGEDRENSIKRFLDLTETVVDVVRDHEEDIEALLGGPSEVDVSEQSSLVEVIRSEDEVTVTMEVPVDETDLSLSLDKENYELIVVVSGEEVCIGVPRDVDPKTVDAKVKNGILEVKMERNIQDLDSSIEFVDESDADENVDDKWGDEDGS